MASVSDTVGGQERRTYPHDISTFSILGNDTLPPAFESYVIKDGLLNVASRRRSIHGLGLDEFRDWTDMVNGFNNTAIYSADDTFRSTSSTSDAAREINSHVSLPLPFSDDITTSRFANLPSNLAGRYG